MTLTPPVRKAAYAFGVALFGALVVYGLVTGNQAESLLAVFAAALNLMAALNVPKPTRTEKETP